MSTSTAPANFQLSLLEEHNRLRAKYGNVKPLVLDESLNKLAKEHADYLASKQSKLENSTNDLVGENLYYLHSVDGSYTAKQVIDFWLKRSDLIPNVKPTKTSHFTQMVWKSSKKLGVSDNLLDVYHFFCCNQSAFKKTRLVKYHKLAIKLKRKFILDQYVKVYVQTTIKIP
jgi:hypothetical protein